MRKNLTFTFLNPNPPQTVEAALKAVLIEKLLAARADELPENEKVSYENCRLLPGQHQSV